MPNGSQGQSVLDEDGKSLGNYYSYIGMVDPSYDTVPASETIWLGDLPVAVLYGRFLWQDDGDGPWVVGLAPQELLYVHSDHLGAPRRLTTAAGAPVWGWDSDPFGKGFQNGWLLGSGEGYEYPLRFPGQIYDEYSWQHLNWHRTYDPLTGRYTQSDPIGLRGGVNTYGYVGQNPVSGIDPFGLAEACGCKNSYLDCMANCIRRYDPLGDTSKFALTAVGGTFPKWLFGFPRGLGGASPVTTVPSAVATATGGGAAGTAGAAARAVGRVASPIWITYGVYLFSMEAYCASSCVGDNCAH